VLDSVRRLSFNEAIVCFYLFQSCSFIVNHDNPAIKLIFQVLAKVHEIMWVLFRLKISRYIAIPYISDYLRIYATQIASATELLSMQSCMKCLLRQRSGHQYPISVILRSPLIWGSTCRIFLTSNFRPYIQCRCTMENFRDFTGTIALSMLQL